MYIHGYVCGASFLFEHSIRKRARLSDPFESSEKRRMRTSILDLRATAFMPGVGTFSKLGWRGSVQDSLKVEVLFLVLRSGKLLRCLRDNLSDGRLGGAATAILTGRWEEMRVSLCEPLCTCVRVCVCVCISSVYSLALHFNHADLRKWQIILTSREEIRVCVCRSLWGLTVHMQIFTLHFSVIK